MTILLDTLATLRKQADKTDEELLRRLARVYAAGYADIDPTVQALVEQIEALQKAGKVTAKQVKASAIYKKLISEMTRELDDYSAVVRTELRQSVTESAKSGLSGGQLLMLAALADAIGVAINDVPRETVKAPLPDALSFLADYLNPDGVLYGKINGMSRYRADEVAAGILDLVTQGKNPKLIGRFIQDAYGTGLSDSLRMMRTAQLYSYRQANAAVQLANADLLQGGVWCAEINDPDICMGCISLHGTVFPVGEIADDHHNGRCTILPWVKGEPNPIQQTGEEWFKLQPESEQEKRMGKEYYAAYKEGKFDIDQLSTTYRDDVYGEMRRVTNLKDLVSEE